MIQMQTIPEEETPQYLAKIYDEATRIGDMAFELLDFARGRVTLMTKKQSLKSFMEEMQRFLRNYIDENVEIFLVVVHHNGKLPQKRQILLEVLEIFVKQQI
jgi:sugar-specific transcriptional regulator TrmB